MNRFDRLRSLYRDEQDSQTGGDGEGLMGRLTASGSSVNGKLIVFRSALSESVQQIMSAPTFSRLRHSLDDDLSMRRLAETPAFLRLASLWAKATDPETGGAPMKRLFEDAHEELGALPATREALARVIARAKAHGKSPLP